MAAHRRTAVPSRTPMDILQNFLIRAEDEQVRVSVTNLQTTITAWV